MTSLRDDACGLSERSMHARNAAKGESSLGDCLEEWTHLRSSRTAAARRCSTRTRAGWMKHPPLMHAVAPNVVQIRA
eukprot:6199334-Pleurochrysis_carterae.AAC.4